LPGGSTHAGSRGRRERPDPLGKAVGSVPSGLFIVTAGKGLDVSGYLGSFIQQVSIEPLLLVVAMHPQRPAYRLARRTGELVVHVLGRNNEAMLRRFWNGLGPEELLELPHRRSELGTPILEGVLAFIRCRVLEEWKAGDHAVLLAAAEEGSRPGRGRPRCYHRASGRGY
jgi:flavin reductase (DIM6/NTAB) family NADH-FMN oxidoreductase RutF